MKQRINYPTVEPKSLQAMLRLSQYPASAGLDEQLHELVSLRVSQINGCAFCLDMHANALRRAGYPQRNLDLLTAWREVDGYTDVERAALAWAEVVTKLPHNEVPDSEYEAAREVFNENELIALTMAVVAINGWNRLNIAFRTPPAG
jgi:AhpD family alkylhydroperoxidase